MHLCCLNQNNALLMHPPNISYSTLLNWPFVSLLILFILFGMFFVLIHDCTLCFTGSPCCNFSYYNYISIWPYHIVIHLRVHILAFKVWPEWFTYMGSESEYQTQCLYTQNDIPTWVWVRLPDPMPIHTEWYTYMGSESDYQNQWLYTQNDIPTWGLSQTTRANAYTHRMIYLHGVWVRIPDPMPIHTEWYTFVLNFLIVI